MNRQFSTLLKKKSTLLKWRRCFHKEGNVATRATLSQLSFIQNADTCELIESDHTLQETLQTKLADEELKWKQQTN